MCDLPHPLPPGEEMLRLNAKDLLERAFLEDYLATLGHDLSSVKNLPPEDNRKVMTAACLYASLRLTQIEATAMLLEGLHNKKCI
jgi:hypothetical protein